MLKNVRKWAIALVLVFGLFILAGCNAECPECEAPTKSECTELFPCPEQADPTQAVCDALYPNADCPTCPEAPECPTCPTCPETPDCKQDFVAPTSVILFGDDVKVGATLNLATEMEVAPATAFKSFTWASSNPSIATVSADGVVTGVRPGKVEITVKSVLNAKAATAEVTVSETGAAFDIATREVAYIANKLSGYVAESFVLPQPWNGNAKVVYYDVDGDVIESFVMPDLGEATSKSYTVTYKVTFGDIPLENTVNLKLVNLKLVDEIEDNDFAKVDAAIEVIGKLFSNITAGKGTDKVSGDIQLPPSYDGVSYNWTTNKNYILANNGKFIRPDNDTTVTYTISPKSGAAARSATLVFNVNGFTSVEKHAFNTSEGVFASIEKATISSSFLLPTRDEKFGISYDYVLPLGLSLDSAYVGNDKFVKVLYDGTTVKAAAEIGVIARYEEVSGFQFVENQKLTVNLGGVNAAYADVEAFLDGTNALDTLDLDGVTLQGLDLLAVLHMPYGGNGTETTVITLPTTVGGSTVVWAADGNFEAVAPGAFQLVTQFFRYHEAKLTATFTNGADKAKVEFFINVGLAEKPLTYYQGGQSNSNQGSTDPAKRGDMLQNFSFWDQYVGIVTSEGLRTTNQYWSEFSGYTFWIDETVAYVDVTITKDATTGVITAVPAISSKTIRYQLFVMQFEVNRIYKYDTYEGQNVPRVDVRYARATYGGNFSHFLVNETGIDLDIPVSTLSTLSIGGYFADKETAMKTYSLTSLVIKDDGTDKKDTTVKDDYGSSYKVSRDNTIAYDGYRPGFSLKSNGKPALAEGAQDKYDFYMGSTVKQHLNTDGTYKTGAWQESATSTQYIQYCIAPALSSVYKTPYVIIGARSYAFHWNSQGYYSLSADFTRAMTGGVRGALIDPDGTPSNGDEFYAPAQVTVARYTRHVNNEELTDYFVREVNKLSTDYSDVSQAQINAYLAVQKIPAATAGFGDAAWLPSWLAKETAYSGSSPKLAAAKLAQIAIDTEAAALRQKQYAESVHDKINALAAMHATGGWKSVAYTATVAFKDLANTSYGIGAAVPANTIVTASTYAVLGAVDQAAYTADATDATRVLILKGKEATTLMSDADTLYAALTPGRLSFITAGTYNKLKAAKAELEIDALNATAALANAAPIAAALATLEACGATGLVTTNNTDKVYGLSLAIQYFNLPEDADVVVGSKKAINDARTAFVGANGARQAYLPAGWLAKIVAKEAKLALAYQADTIKYVGEIKAAAATLLDDTAVDFSALTSAQLTVLTNSLKSVDNLVATYKVLYTFATLQAAAAVDAAGVINAASKVVVYHTVAAPGVPVAYTKAEIDALSTAAATRSATIAFIEAEKVKAALDPLTLRPVLDLTFGNMSGRDDSRRIQDLYNAMDNHNRAKADAAEDLIDAIPPLRALTVADEAKIVAARAGYNALTADQKAKVTPSRVTDLTDLEAAIIETKLEAIALPVEDLIYALPSRLTLANAEAVAAARVAYDALTPKQKAKVSSLRDLTAAEVDILAIQNETAALSPAVIAVIADLTTKLSNTGVVTSANIATFKAYTAAFDALLGYEKAYIISISNTLVKGTLQPDFGLRLALYKEAIAKLEFFTPAA